LTEVKVRFGFRFAVRCAEIPVASAVDEELDRAVVAQQHRHAHRFAAMHAAAEPGNRIRRAHLSEDVVQIAERGPEFGYVDWQSLPEELRLLAFE